MEYIEHAQNFYNNHIDMVKKVGEVFTDYFGEELVDVQIPSLNDLLTSFKFTMNNEEDYTKFQSFLLNSSSEYSPNAFDIIIRFPFVTVTNERKESIDVHDLYTKVTISNTGKYKQMKMLTATFTPRQYSVGYMHSHLQSFSQLPTWKNPCLGTGPLVNTVSYLSHTCNLDFWGLFCYELSNYVTIESLSGGPYIPMSRVLANRSSSWIHLQYGPICFSNLPQFSYSYGFHCHRTGIEELVGKIRPHILNVIKNLPIKFAFDGKNYQIGDNLNTLWIKFSKELIHLINEDPDVNYSLEYYIEKYILIRCIIKDSEVYQYKNNVTNDVDNIPRDSLLTFKGKDVKIKILHTDSSVSKPVYLINPGLFSGILSGIILLLNTYYGRKEEFTGKELHFV